MASVAPGAIVTPSQLAWLEFYVTNVGRLKRRERRRLAHFERLCHGALAFRHWRQQRGRMPSGRVGELERIERVRLVLFARSELAAVLVRRIRALAPPLRPMPEHGRRCPSGCGECAAIARWRNEYELLSGFGAYGRRNGYLFP